MRYLGNKERIVPEIKQVLREKNLLRRNLVFFDAFCGTGSVAYFFKETFHLIINDIMQWSKYYSLGRITSGCCSFSKLGFDPFSYFAQTDKICHGFFYKNYSPAGSERMYFTPENAGKIDFIRTKIGEWKDANLLNDAEYAYLLYALIEGVSSVSNTAGVYGAFLKKWESRALKKIVISPVRRSLFNQPVSVDAYCARAEDIVSNVECDILYLDPPYTQNQYGTQYHILETLVLYDNPSISKITGSRPVTPLRSLWSRDKHAHMLFDQLIHDSRASHVVVSYSSDGILSQDFIESILKRYGKPESYFCKKIDYRKYNNFKCRNNEGVFEFIFYIEKLPCDLTVYESPLNYAGSKARAVPEIRAHLPKKISTFVDMFGGGFNVGINVNAERIIYNDINYFVEGLIRSFYLESADTYLEHVRQTISTHNLFPNCKREYNALKSLYNSFPAESRSSHMLYALILYGFQQQIRFNSHMEFNVPPGSRYFNDRLLAKFISFLRQIKNKNISFCHIDFIKFPILDSPRVFYYFDPPYRKTTATYNDGKRGFSGWDIKREKLLCGYLDKLNAKGLKFMLSCMLDSGKVVNEELKSWVSAKNYRVIPISNPQGRYSDRSEVLVVNY